MRISDWSSDVCSSDLAEGGDAGWIEWEFTPDARKLIQESETYAVLNRQAVLGFRSTYALKLYELGALRLHRRQSNWRGDMSALRAALGRSGEHTSELQSLMRISYAVFCLKKKKEKQYNTHTHRNDRHSKYKATPSRRQPP